MTFIHIMSGIPASGKSTYAESQAYLTGAPVIHRDAVRAALRDYYDSNEYFPCSETEEYDTFVDIVCGKIRAHKGGHIWIDQTTLSIASAKRLISAIHRRMKEENIEMEFTIEMMVTPYSICIERNAKRAGFERVPQDVIDSMYYTFERTVDNCRMRSTFLVKGCPVHIRMHHYERGDTQR